ncbi:MAG: diacylglycerol kinase, partial [Victivallales bacterium]|nr:diacylglycerol kinase [Victivallales bacterium]
MNSAVEAIVDLVSPGWNELAKRAKDIGSAAVFCMLVLFWGSWLFIILKMFVWTN